jgi:hypothetical protein
MNRLRWWRALPLVLTLPMLGGAGICGVVLVDIAQRDLILDPVDRITFEADHGDVEVFSFDRNGISLFYYMVGSLYDIGETGHRINGRTLDVMSLCEHDDFCNVSWYAEVMPATAVDVIANGGAVKLTGVDAPITADVSGGGFDGVGLRAPTLDIGVDAGDINLDYAATPTAVTVVLGEGNVTVTLPPGTYRCELASAEGEIDSTGVTCDPMAASVVHIEIDSGDITLLPGPMP